MLQAERDRDAGLTAAATALEEFKANLAAEQAALAPLETAAHSAFKGYRKFVRLLSDAYQKAAAPGAALDENQLLAELRELLGKTQRRPGPLPEVPVAAGVQVPAGLGADRAVRGPAGPAAVRV